MKHIGFIIGLTLLIGCGKKDPAFVESNFPQAINDIMTTKCATVGCHNDKSYKNAANLNLTSWDNLLKGGSNGAVVIPFSPSHSSLMQFINTYSDLGLMTNPSMPLNQAPLSREEVISMRTWIEQGCPNKAGEIPFANDYATRSKVYITNQGCDLVSVIDPKSGLVMRTVKVGHDDGQIEVPHNLKVSDDGKYWYLCFANGAYVQKFDTRTDQLVGEVNIGLGAWNVFTISSDFTKGMVSELTSQGRLVELNLNTMTILKVFDSPGLFTFPHGICYTKSGDTVYVAAQNGNMMYRLILSLSKITKISLDKGVPPLESVNTIRPHSIIPSKDYSTLYVTCDGSNEIRVIKQDTIFAIIPTAFFPQEMAISHKHNLLFVSCAENINPFYPSFKGAITVIDLNTNQVVRTIHEKFFQPHGVMVDDKHDLLYVPSRNVSPNGPAPHHKSECDGANGFFHIIDITTWKTTIAGSEISVDPYSVDVKE